MSGLPPLLCTKCGECCRHIGMIKELASFAGPDGICIHLRGNLCDIYDSRPDLCNYEKAYARYFSHLQPVKYHQIISNACQQFKGASNEREQSGE